DQSKSAGLRTAFGLAAEEDPRFQVVAANQLARNIRVAVLRGVVLLGVAQEAEALAVQFQDATHRSHRSARRVPGLIVVVVVVIVMLMVRARRRRPMVLPWSMRVRTSMAFRLCGVAWWPHESHPVRVRVGNRRKY